MNDQKLKIDSIRLCGKTERIPPTEALNKQHSTCCRTLLLRIRLAAMHACYCRLPAIHAHTQFLTLKL